MTVVIIGLRPTIETAKLHEFSEKHTGMLQILK